MCGIAMVLLKLNFHKLFSVVASFHVRHCEAQPKQSEEPSLRAKRSNL